MNPDKIGGNYVSETYLYNLVSYKRRYKRISTKITLLLTNCKVTPVQIAHLAIHTSKNHQTAAKYIKKSHHNPARGWASFLNAGPALSQVGIFPASAECWSNVVLMVGRRLRLRPTINATLSGRLVLLIFWWQRWVYLHMCSALANFTLK